mgnify:CR=1 FL=1
MPKSICIQSVETLNERFDVGTLDNSPVREEIMKRDGVATALRHIAFCRSKTRLAWKDGFDYELVTIPFYGGRCFRNGIRTVERYTSSEVAKELFEIIGGGE